MTKTWHNPGGSSVPSLEAFELEWKEAAKLLDEDRRLHEQLREAGLKGRELQAEIRSLRDEHRRGRVEALRSGEEEPSDAAIVAKEAALEKLHQREKDLRQARELTKRDLYYVVETHREEYAPDLEKALAERVTRLEEQTEAMRATLYELGACARLGDWLREPQRGFGISPLAGSTALEAILSEARHAAAVAGSVRA